MTYYVSPLENEIEDFVQAAAEGNSAAVIEFLGKHKYAVNEWGFGSKSALHHAAAEGHIDIIKILLDNGADIEGRDAIGWTAIMGAIKRGHKDVVQFLVDRDADINAKDQRGIPPLMMAVLQGQKGIAEFLLEKGAPVDERDDNHCTAQIYAEKTFDTEMVVLLERRRQMQERKSHEQWLSDTDHSKGLRHPIRATRPLGMKP